MDTLARRALQLLLSEPLQLALMLEGREIAAPGYRRQSPKWAVGDEGASATVTFSASGRMVFDAVALMSGDQVARTIPEGRTQLPAGMPFVYTAELGVK